MAHVGARRLTLRRRDVGQVLAERRELERRGGDAELLEEPLAAAGGERDEHARPAGADADGVGDAAGRQDARARPPRRPA